MPIYKNRFFNKSADGKFEQVEIEYSIFGKEMKDVFDCKIEGGKHVVIDGNGWIKDGTVIEEIAIK